MLAKKIKQFKKVLKIKNEIVGIKFTEKLPADCKSYRDTACTALARTIIKKKAVVFNANSLPQLCQGANYFLKLTKTKNSEVYDAYVSQEQVFKNKKICALFLKNLPKFPELLKNKFIVIEPFKSQKKYQIIILLVNPAQAGRIFGLLNYDQYRTVEVCPNQPTCLSLFAPLATKKIHCNFIDYYDRYYQGKIKGKHIWPETKMIISLRFQDFRKVLNSLEKSPQGSFQPKLSPQQVDDV